MSTVPATAAPREVSSFARLRNLVIGASFAVVLLVPKILRIRQNPGSWFAFRTILGTAGVALVLLPLTLASNWIAAPAGLGMFLASILLGPARRELDVNAKARELGAFVVVNGGGYRSGKGAPVPAHLFVGVERIGVLDSRHRPLVLIPVNAISSARAVPQSGAWALEIRWADRVAEFVYHGAFAEHFAQVAENTLASVIPSPLPVLQRSRAAGA
jgi:hypothetical protein